MNTCEIEMDSKFMTELENLRQSILTEQNKNSKEATTVRLDESLYLSKVHKLIKEYIQRYDADKTGVPDFALESSG